MAASLRKKSLMENLALSVAAGMTVNAAAKVLGCGERTAYRYSTLPDFRSRVEEIRRMFLDAALGQLVCNSTRASTALHELIDSADESIRLKAARQILILPAWLSDQMDIRKRVERIEEIIRSAAEAKKGE